MSRKARPADLGGVFGIDIAAPDLVDCSEPPAAVDDADHRYAVRNDESVFYRTARMAENRRAGIVGRAEPTICLDIIDLYETDIAVIVPARDEINISVLISEGDSVIDRGRHIGEAGVVFRQRIECAKAWPKEMFLSFNLSSAQLMDPTTGLSVMAMLSKMDFDPRRIEIEITETAMMSDPETAERIIDEMRAIGIRILLDDFGTGQSSLGRLRDFSFDKVKIDRSFIATLGDDVQSEHIVTAILNMCKALELSVIAEGIETREQAEKLVQLGCTDGQGYYFGRPANAETTLDYFRKSDGKSLNCRTTAPGCCGG